MSESYLARGEGFQGRGCCMCKGMDDKAMCVTNPCLLITTTESCQCQSPLIVYSLKYGPHCLVSSNFGLYFGHCQ